jgi:hypothetical protein
VPDDGFRTLFSQSLIGLSHYAYGRNSEVPISR